MKAPYVVRMEVLDADGKQIQVFEQRELDDESLVAVQEAVTGALVGLGKAGVALKGKK